MSFLIWHEDIEMFQTFHFTDHDGNPIGGHTFGRGFSISWQMGPLGRGKDRKEPNGAFIEDIIQAAINRLEFYQSSKFRCDENMKAIDYLWDALHTLNKRTKDRESRGVEGTYNA